MALSELNVRLGLITKKFNSELQATQRKLGRFQRDIGNTGKRLTQSLTVPLGAAGLASIKLATNLSTNFKTIKNLVGVADDEIAKFGKGVADTSGLVSRSQQELSGALFTITSAGKRGTEALDILTTAAKASNIGLGETGLIAKTTTAILTAYKNENLSAARATDILAATVREGNLEASALAPALGDVLGIASRLKVPFEEVGASIATLTRLGTGPEAAITGLTGLLSGLLKPTDKGAKALAKLGLTYEDLRESISNKGLAVTLNGLVKSFDGNDEALTAIIPNIRALKTVLGTAGAQGEDYIEILNNIRNSTGLVDKGFEDVSKGSAFQFRQAFVDLQNIGIEIGQILLPTAVKVTKRFREILEVFKGLSPETKKNVIQLGLLAASIGPVLIGVSKFVGLAKLALSGLGLLSGAIALVPKALILLSNPVTKLSSGVALLTKGFAVFKTALIGINPLVAAVGAAIAIGVSAYRDYNRELTRAGATQTTLTQISKRAQEEVIKERVGIEKIREALNDSNEGYSARVKAISALQSINNGYFSDLDAEKSSINDITNAMYDYLEAIQKRAQVIAAQEKLVDIEKRLLDVQERQAEAGPSLAQAAKNLAGSFFSLGGATDFAARQGLTAVNNFDAETNSLLAQRDALTKLIATRDADSESRLANKVITPTVSGPVVDTSNIFDGKTFGASGSVDIKSNLDVALLPAIEKQEALNGLLQAGQSLTAGLGTITESTMADIASTIDLTSETYLGIQEPLQTWSSLLDELGLKMNDIGQAAIDFGSLGALAIGEFAQGFEDVISGSKTAAQAFKNVVASIIKSLVKQGIIAAISNTLKSGTALGPLAIPLAAAAGTAASALFKRFARLKDGGIVPPGFPNDTFPAFLSSDEAVIPLDKLGQYTQGLSGTQVFIPEVRLAGEDLYMSFKRSEASANRMY